MQVGAEQLPGKHQVFSFDAVRLCAKWSSIGEGGQIVTDVHDAQINQQVADPWPIKCSVAIVQPGPEHTASCHAKRKEESDAPAVVKELVNDNHVM